jgi:hypothetical protein
MPDNASTELALIKLLSDQLAAVQGLSSRVEHLAERLGRLEHQSQHRHDQIMTALETLTASVMAATTELTELTTAVNAAVVELGADTPTDAQLLTLAAAIDANTANAKTLADVLNKAVTPPVVTPPTV